MAVRPIPIPAFPLKGKESFIRWHPLFARDYSPLSGRAEDGVAVKCSQGICHAHGFEFRLKERDYPAPGYFMAKLIIHLINAVGDVLNRDPAVHDHIRVVFLPNFNVSSGQRVYPAADRSEQISTAGKEASGPGNMKFQMNGALTIGTLDGANIEIREEVGAGNFFLFGLTAPEVAQLWANGHRPMGRYESDAELSEVIDLIRTGFFSRGDVELFRPLVDNLLLHDPYLVLADFRSYVECQHEAGLAYADRERWSQMSILNTARSGKFSSDRTIREYAEQIWHAKPVPIKLLSRDDVKGKFLQ